MGMILWCVLILIGSGLTKARGNWCGFFAYCFVIISACSLGYLDLKYLGNYMFNFTDRWGFWWFLVTIGIFFIQTLIIILVMCVIDKSWWVVVKKMFKK